jgi:hypothetical protein
LTRLDQVCIDDARVGISISVGIEVVAGVRVGAEKKKA